MLTAHDGNAGYELLRNERPDVAVLDIGLTGLNGYELARMLNEEGTRPPTLVAVTGYGHEANVARAKWVRFDHHLVKPTDVAAILKQAAGKPA